MLRLAGASLLAALFLAPAGCFYTTSINERPRADIEVSPGPYYPDKVFTVQAFESSDIEDGADIECTWSVYSCNDLDCADQTVLYERLTQRCDELYPVYPPLADHRPKRVVLTVTDSDGATFDDETIVPIGNRLPVIEGPQPQYAGTADRAAVSIPVRVSVKWSDDDHDEVALSWQLIKPRGGGADVELQPLDEDGLTQEFTPDVADVWTVEVTADDNAGGQTTSAAMIAVQEDAPPCIVQTLPAADSGPPLRAAARGRSPHLLDAARRGRARSLSTHVRRGVPGRPDLRLAAGLARHRRRDGAGGRRERDGDDSRSVSLRPRRPR